MGHVTMHMVLGLLLVCEPASRETNIFVAAFLYRIDIADTKYTVSISNSITQTTHAQPIPSPPSATVV